MQEFSVRTSRREEFIPITDQVHEALKEAGVTSGMCLIFVPHTTAGVTINENADPSVARDMLGILRELAPQQSNYQHLEGNSDAHCKATLVGSSAAIIVDEGRLQLGTWQGVFFCEFDGPRNRRCWVRVLGA
jgi:secondary thiamine-phosphate synthase enzyme